MDIKRIDINQKLKLYKTSAKEKEISKNAVDSNKNADNKTKNHAKITISPEAKNLNILDYAASQIKYEMDRDLSEINAEKINALREQIKNGEYMINSRDIAAAIITGTQEM